MYRLAILFVVLLGVAGPARSAPLLMDVNDSLRAGVDSVARSAPANDTSQTAVAGMHPAPDDSATTPSASVVPSRKDLPAPFAMITNLPGDWVTWGKNSFKWKYLPLLGGVALATAATIYTDADTYQPLKREYERTKWFRDASSFSVNFGDGKYQFGLGVAFGLYGFIFNDTVALRTASQVTEVILACGAVVQLLKHTTGRESPFVATSPTGRWAIFPDQIDYAKRVPHYDAFPSGHVATALSTLTVIAENYPDQKWIRWVGYPAIAALGVGMVAEGIHWWSDYPLSIVLGYSFGMLVAHRDDPEGESGSHAESRLIGTPEVRFLSDGTPAFGMSWSW